MLWFKRNVLQAQIILNLKQIFLQTSRLGQSTTAEVFETAAPLQNNRSSIDVKK